MLNKFIQTMKERGVAKSSHFAIDFNLPVFLTGDGTVSFYTYDTIKLFCEGAALPEMALATTTLKDYGVNREVVYDKMYGTLPLTFICDQGMYIKQFFDAWIQGIAAYRGGLFEYPDRYTSDWLKVYQLNSEKNAMYETKFRNIYPKVVNDVQLGASSRDYSRFQVLFTYESWESRIVDTVQTTESMRATKVLFNSYRDNVIFASRPVTQTPSNLVYQVLQDAYDVIGGGLITSPTTTLITAATNAIMTNIKNVVPNLSVVVGPGTTLSSITNQVSTQITGQVNQVVNQTVNQGIRSANEIINDTISQGISTIKTGIDTSGTPIVEEPNNLPSAP